MCVRWFFLSMIIFGMFSIISLAGPVINEVAWGGAPDNPTAEWIELYNPGEQAVSLAGWRILSSDGAPDIALVGTIPAGGYYLLERGTDDAVPGIKADLIYTGALRDSGEGLFLLDPRGRIVDSANKDGGPWPGGTNRLGNPPCASMERIDPAAPDSPENWATSRTSGGTPDAQNSACNPPPVLQSVSFTPPIPHPDEPVLFKAKVKNGNAPLFMWNFGDGATGEGQTASHTYVQTGTYTVSLTLKDDAGAITQEEKKLRVVEPRTVLIDFSVLSPDAKRIRQSGDVLTFLDESTIVSGKLVGWSWEFGDGTAAARQTASHTYLQGGCYVVTHSVTDDQGEITVQTRSLLVNGRYPTACFHFRPKNPNAGEPVTFAATGSFDPDGTALNYEWDFDGNGTTDLVSATPTVTHTYARGGDYSCMLIVRDSDADGAKRSLPFTVSVHVNYLPHACFKLSNFSPREGDKVKFTDCSSDPDGKIAAWHWDFGDGTTAAVPSPTHTYLCAGSYTVTLTVTDDNGAQSSTQAKITVQPAPPHVELKVVGLTEQLTKVPFTFKASAFTPCPKRKIVSYAWDFDGDGTYDQMTNCPTITHAYMHVPGLQAQYHVTVKAIDTVGLTAVSTPVTVTVRNRVPTARFIWKPSTLTDAQTVSFTDQSHDLDGKVIAWYWSFGDGGYSTAQSPAHQFLDDGTYTVTLTVTDDSGAKSLTSSQVITVTNALPVAQFDAPVTATVGVPVHFHDSSYDPSPHGMIVHTAWDFGDGTTCPGMCGGGPLTASVHTYTTPGTYTVELVVIDDDGGLTRMSKQITVSPSHQ